MSENPITKNNTVSLEAAASWNTRYVTSDGFVCQLTVRGGTGKDLLEKANAALSWLKENGYLPSEFNSYRSRSNNAKPENKNQPSKWNGSHGESENLCPIHQCEVEFRIWNLTTYFKST